MPVSNGVGYGEHTPLKQEHFEKMLGLHMDITTQVQRNWKEKDWTGPDLDRYYYFDINAGAGSDPTGLIGSPLIFIKQARIHHLDFKAVLIERELENYRQLSNVIGDSRITIECGDHNDVLPNYFVGGPQRFGLVYADPSGTIPPFDLLGQMSRQPVYKRLDICIYVHATNIKRIRRSSLTNEKRCLRDFLDGIDKKQWIVREPVGQEQWSFLIGSNWINFPDWQKEGFHSYTSVKGKEILDRLTYTVEEIAERNGQAAFPFFNSPDLVTGLTEPTQSI